MRETESKPVKRNILVVDDTPQNLRLMSGVLMKQGYEVRPIPSGVLALEAAENDPPDLVLLDINMPELDGYETCRRLKAHPRLRDVPVIFVTALNETVDKVRGFEAGGVDYITKPFQFEEVLARVKTHLELRRLQRESEERYEQLKKLEQLKDDLTHMIIHDLRSPLQSIRGYIELVLTGEGALDGSQRDDLSQASASAESLNEMVTDLLDITRLEQERMPLRKTPCDLRKLAQNAADCLGGLAADHTFGCVFPEQEVNTECDQRLVRRVVSNLLGNAFKFTPKGTKVILQVSGGDGQARIEVRDAGPGIPDDYKERIFEKFGQVESKGERTKYSTGLGLTFCKMAVEAHGGQIGVRSRIGEGSTLWFSLPCAVSKDGGPVPGASEVFSEKMPPLWPARRILVMEDDMKERETFQTYLEKGGYAVETAPNGREAFQMIESTAYDLVISDAIVPERAAMEMLMELRREFRDLPVIIVSNGVEASESHVCGTASLLGARAVLKKPIGAEKLLQTVRSLLVE